MNRSKFQRGSGIFKCECCGRGTRDTGVQSVGSRLCPDCYELAGYENLVLDEGLDALTDGDKAQIRAHCANVVAKGGKLDSGSAELLAKVQP